MVGFVHFSNFFIPSEKYYKLQSCWITLHFPFLLQGIPDKYIYGYFGYVREFGRILEDFSHFCPLSFRKLEGGSQQCLSPFWEWLFQNYVIID